MLMEPWYRSKVVRKGGKKQSLESLIKMATTYIDQNNIWQRNDHLFH